MDFFLAGLSYNFSSGRVRPYAGFAAGLARHSNPSEAQAEFAGKFFVGLKAFLTPWLGLRLEGGGYATRLGEAPFGFPCTTFPTAGGSFAPVSCAKSWLVGGTVEGGLVFAF